MELCDYSEIEKNHTFTHPLIIGCSGGQGHNVAIKALTENLKKNKVIISFHKPRDFSKMNLSSINQFQKLSYGLSLLHERKISKVLSWLLSKTPLPVIPSRDEITQEINNISNFNQEERPYIDMLLDVYPIGFHHAAIWNILKRKDETRELRKLIKLKKLNDKINYITVKTFFFDLLKQAFLQEKPYTDIVCAHPIGLLALCDAVKEYNQAYTLNNPIKIKLFLTDFLNEGANHFLSTLLTLTALQRQQIYLIGVGLKKNLLTKYGLANPQFHSYISLDPYKNPIIRAGFNNPLLNEISFNKDTSLRIQRNNADEIVFDIKANEKIATLMLGSQGSTDIVDYVKKFLAFGGFSKIFVFEAKVKDTFLSSLLKQVLHTGKIIILDEQDDNHIAHILKRSNIILMRAGGLSVMEQMAIPHNKEQIILIHNKEINKKRLTSGISWEDKNAEHLISFLARKNVIVKKTSTLRISSDLAEVDLFRESTLSEAYPAYKRGQHVY